MELKLDKFFQSALTGDIQARSRALLLLPGHVLGRLYMLAGILALECVILAYIPHSSALLGPVAPFGIAAFAMFLCLGHSALQAAPGDLTFNSRLFAAHLACVTGVCLSYLGALHGVENPLRHHAPIMFRTVFLLGMALLALAFIPLKVWIETIRTTSPLWLYACTAGLLASALRDPLQGLWSTSISGGEHNLQASVFYLVHAILRFFLSDISADPNTSVIGTPRFAVSIEEPCSGVEGLGLVLVFTGVWLWYFRKEHRFPQVLLLVPCALGCVWLLNVVRICTIVLIGDAGAPNVAMVGFHSQAGWIAFTFVTLTFARVTQKLSWVRRVPLAAPNSPCRLTRRDTSFDGAVPSAHLPRAESPETGAYLIPILVILAASFVSRAASGYFEWLYPLRFIAAAVAIWHFWPHYRNLNWRFGWVAPVIGTAVFLIWISQVWWTPDRPTSALGSALACLPPTARYTWIAFRIVAAVITVPIAEELAFRGYLLRRLISRNFDNVPFTHWTVLSVGLSSVIFGLMHGKNWMAGILSGVAYASALKWRGRIGDAVVAHATSNLLLAAWVLVHSDWSLW